MPIFDTTYKRCYKCKYFSRDTRNLIYRKRFKWFRLKYWAFMFSKLNFWSEGGCTITTIDHGGEHVNMIMQGYESCIFENVERNIVNVRDFIGKIPDDPEKMEEAIRKIENKQYE